MDIREDREVVLQVKESHQTFVYLEILIESGHTMTIYSPAYGSRAYVTTLCAEDYIRANRSKWCLLQVLSDSKGWLAKA